MTATRRPKASPFAMVFEWATAPENRKTVITALGLVVAFLGGGAAHDLHSVIPVTRGQLDSAKVEFVESSSLTAALAVSAALHRYDDSLKVVAQEMTDSVGVPLINAVNSLSARVRRIEEGQGITSRKIDNLPPPDNATIQELRRLVESLEERDQYGPALEQVLREISAMKQTQQAMEKRLNKKVIF